MRSQLDLLKPSTESRVEQSQRRQKARHDQHARERHFTEGDTVYVRNYGQGEMWLPGIIAQVIGPVSSLIDLTDGKQVKHHQDQIRKCYSPSTELPVIPETIEISIPEETGNLPPLQTESTTPQVSPDPQESPPKTPNSSSRLNPSAVTPQESDIPPTDTSDR